MFRPGNLGHLGRLGPVAASQPSLIAQALAILAKYGSNANLYLPGVGAINGITAGNWLDSVGTTDATVDKPVGLVVSAGKEVGPNICPDYDSAAWQTLGSDSPNWVRSAGVASVVGDGVSLGAASKFIRVSGVFAANKSYEVSFEVLSSNNVGGFSVQNNNDNTPLGWVTTVGKYKYVHKSGGVNPEMLGIQALAGWTGSIGPLSVREIPGAHLTQSTAANRPVLRLSGGVYAWDFVSSDSFTSTMTPGNAGFFCLGARFIDSGTMRTLVGAGAGGPFEPGVWLNRNIDGNLALISGNGAGRDIAVAACPSGSTFVASCGWDASAALVGVNNTETSGVKTRNFTSANTINLGVLTGTTNPMLGTIGATIIMPTVLPTASERATLRQLIASLSGVTM